MINFNPREQFGTLCSSFTTLRTVNCSIPRTLQFVSTTDKKNHSTPFDCVVRIIRHIYLLEESVFQGLIGFVSTEVKILKLSLHCIFKLYLETHLFVF